MLIDLNEKQLDRVKEVIRDGVAGDNSPDVIWEELEKLNDRWEENRIEEFALLFNVMYEDELLREGYTPEQARKRIESTP